MSKSNTENQLSSKIILGHGIGALRFGLSRSEVHRLLGKTDTTGFQPPHTDTGATVYHYPALGLDLTFDEEHEGKLSFIDVHDGPFILMDSITLGVSWVYTRQQAQMLGLGIPNEERCAQWDLQCYHAHSLICWFKNKTLVKISFGHFWNSDGEPLWPTQKGAK